MASSAGRTESVRRDGGSVVSRSAFQFTRLADGKRKHSARLFDVLPEQAPGRQRWLFVSPHDDDLCLGAGLWLQAAVAAGVEVQVVVVTDGSLGYCRADHRECIVQVRREETLASFNLLGIPPRQVTFLGFPDAGLSPFQGRRPARQGEPAIEGWTGLQNSLTYHLRRTRPGRVFVPTATDLHPDHRTTHSELMISLFHASGAIWPELGPPLLEVPALYELAVYCDFCSPPNLQVQADKGAFETKLDSIAAYRSQVQIAALVESTRHAGPFEYLRECAFRLYSPATYRPLFD